MSTHAVAGPPDSTRRPAPATIERGRGRRRIRALVLAADPPAAAAIRRRLERHSAIEVVGSVGSPDAADAQCARTRIDVLVAVSDAPEAQARALQRAASIRTRFPATRVVVALGSEQRLWPTLVARPDGLFSAAAPSPEIEAVVGAAAGGHLAIGRSLREAFYQSCVPASEHSGSPLDELTSREVQVLSYGARGLTSREIATELHLAVNTVDKALTVIYRKLRARNRTEACLIASRRGLLR